MSSFTETPPGLPELAQNLVEIMTDMRRLHSSALTVIAELDHADVARYTNANKPIQQTPTRQRIPAAALRARQVDPRKVDLGHRGGGGRDGRQDQRGRLVHPGC